MRRVSKVIVSLMLTIALTVSLAGMSFASAKTSNKMLVGVGKADITGPITNISTGYNSLGDLMEGLLMRLNARAFIVVNNGEPMVYVSAELVHMTESIKPGVIKELASRGLTQYTESNVMIACTHCHSSTSNTSWYGLYDLINGVPGYDDDSYNVIVQGIADAIEEADADLAPGSVTLSYADTDIENYNRSLDAAKWNVNYDASKYSSDLEAVAETVNDEMSVFTFKHDGEGAVGLLSFFASHGTSNGIDNTLVASDHKGYAAYYVEQEMGDGFVAAFAQNESGDASPNQPNEEDYHDAFLRPNDVDSSIDAIENEIVDGQQEADAALKILKGGKNITTINLSDVTNISYTTVDFSNISVDKTYIGEYYMPYDDIDNASTSEPCIGAGIIAGDEEGAPVDNAEEGTVRHNFTIDENGNVVRTAYDFSTIDLYGLESIMGDLWPTAMKILQSDSYDDAQMEKVVCLAVGNLMEKTQPLQIYQIGEAAIVAVPFELTTEQAARTREVLESTLSKVGVKKVIFSTLTNSYSQYVTTREEYAAQHYEGSTCLFGPWSGAALTQELDKMAQNIVNGTETDPGPGMVTEKPAVLIDTVFSIAPSTIDIGDSSAIITDVNSNYQNGDTVTAVFNGADPRHITELKLKGELPDDYTYMEVQKLTNGNWVTIKDDEDPYTYYKYSSDSLLEQDLASVNWLLRDVEDGTYRLVYNGYSLDAFGNYNYFTAYSSEFTVGIYNETPFKDVSSANWFYPHVKYVYENGLFAGTSDNTFSPNTTMTRGMLVTVLWSLEGKPTAKASSFNDLTDDWYVKAVNWASANGIVTGYDESTFAPNDPVTREQVAQILYKYSQYKGYNTSASAELTSFTDSAAVSDWAITSVKWAVASKLIVGDQGYIKPTASATRAEVAAILHSYKTNIAK